MGDRFYGQQNGKLGYSKTKVHDHKSAHDKPKRRLKADIVRHICDMLHVDGIVSMDRMTVEGLTVLENILKKKK